MSSTTPSEMPQNPGLPEGFDPSQMPEDMFGSNTNNTGNGTQNSANLLLLAVSVIILLIGLIIAKIYKY